ncbi:conserved hypothetical protein (plasmid) [Picosynechococcus sp. PCC 7002]|nr:conserved hypothetical protein [Picosynechococcus sp. PCC 7002]
MTMKIRYAATLVSISLLSLGAIAGCSGVKNPCAGLFKNPCASKTETADPCASKANPCAAKENPCASKTNPCAAKENPCASKANPCAAKANEAE